MPANSYTLPPPTGGWNDRDSLDVMPEMDAVTLENLIPGVGQVSLRKGYRRHSTGMGAAIESLFEYSKADGTRQLIATANGKIWNATTYDTTATQIGTGFTEDYWQAVNFNNVLVLCNGTDQPQQWDGSTLSAATYTGPTDNDFIHVTSYRSRLYFVQKNSTSIWYGGVDAITGATTEFDFGGIFRNGGYLLWCGAWTRDKGSGSTDLFIACSNMGEILVYTGANPGASDWALAGHFYIGTPLGRRSFVNTGAEMAILTADGLLPLSAMLQDSEITITEKIKNAFRMAAQSYQSNVGWDVVYYTRGGLLICNVPTATNSTANQYIMSTETRGWAKFTNINATCFSLLSDKLYFGGAGGIVYQADYGANDNNASIPWELKQAFSYFGDRSRVKQVAMARPIVRGESAMTYLLGVDVDFDSRQMTGTASVVGTGSLWDSASWDTATWDSGDTYRSPWQSVAGIGRAFSLKLKGSCKNAPFSLYATQVTFLPGGIL